MRSSCSGSSTVLKPEAANLAMDAANDTAAPTRLDGGNEAREWVSDPATESTVLSSLDMLEVSRSPSDMVLWWKEALFREA